MHMLRREIARKNALRMYILYVNEKKDEFFIWLARNVDKKSKYGAQPGNLFRPILNFSKNANK